LSAWLILLQIAANVRFPSLPKEAAFCPDDREGLWSVDHLWRQTSRVPNIRVRSSIGLPGQVTPVRTPNCRTGRCTGKC